jgi:hypothetical protein
MTKIQFTERDLVFVAVLWLMILLVNLFCASCSSPTSTKEVIGESWNSVTGTKWYIMESDSLACERFTFYTDSVVVDIDHFSHRANSIFDSMQVQYRERHVGTVYTKDKDIDYDRDGKIKTYRTTELQWKRYSQSLTDPTHWTPVYDWSVYQMWCIEYKLQGLMCFGDAPNCYEMTIVRPVKLTYVDGWLFDEL